MDLSALLLGDLYYTRLALSGCSAQLSHDSLLELYQILHSNFSSNISKVRFSPVRVGVFKWESHSPGKPGNLISVLENLYKCIKSFRVMDISTVISVTIYKKIIKQSSQMTIKIMDKPSLLRTSVEILYLEHLWTLMF